MQSEFKIDYDLEEDLLFLYDENRKSQGSVEFGDLIVDLEREGKICGLELFEASKYLTDLTGRKIGREDLEKIQKAKISIIEKKGTTIIKMILIIEQEAIPASIAIQNIHYKSPILAKAK